MTLYHLDNATYTAWHGELIDGIRHPLNIEQLWSDDDLAVVDLYKAVDPGIPSDKIATGSHVEVVDGVLTVIYDLEDKPPPTLDELYPALEAWRVWSVADLAGLDIPAGVDASSADSTTKAIARNQWKAPPGGYFTRGNPLFSNDEFLAAFNKTAADINQLWTMAAALPEPA